MISKLYSSIKDFLKKNINFIICILVFVAIINIPVPYYIESPGGLINVDNRIIINNEKHSLGTFNLTYVSELKGNVLTYIMSIFNKEWNLVDKEKIVESENSDFRNKMLLENSISNATYVAYTSLNKKINIIDSKIYIVYIYDEANTDLEIGDVITTVNDKKVESIQDYIDIVSDSSIGDKIEIKTDKGIKKYAEVKNNNGKNNTFIYAICNNSYDINDIKFNFKKSESGSSAGLMIALSIYNKLTDKDLTKGKTIAGTGTIDMNGVVGEISGTKYKLEGAKNGGADVFFSPRANYDEAIKIKNINNYDIEIIPIDEFNDALKYLQNN